MHRAVLRWFGLIPPVLGRGGGYGSMNRVPDRCGIVGRSYASGSDASGSRRPTIRCDRAVNENGTRTRIWTGYGVGNPIGRFRMIGRGRISDDRSGLL